jgi:hypothetical protein
MCVICCAVARSRSLWLARASIWARVGGCAFVFRGRGFPLVRAEAPVRRFPFLIDLAPAVEPPGSRLGYPHFVATNVPRPPARGERGGASRSIQLAIGTELCRRHEGPAHARAQGPRLTGPLDLAGRDALYLSQQLGHRHSALTPPRASNWRTTRHPKRILSSVDESESSSLGGGVAPHPQQAGWFRVSVIGDDVCRWLPQQTVPTRFT